MLLILRKIGNWKLTTCGKEREEEGNGGEGKELAKGGVRGAKGSRLYMKQEKKGAGGKWGQKRRLQEEKGEGKGELRGSRWKGE